MKQLLCKLDSTNSLLSLLFLNWLQFLGCPQVFSWPPALARQPHPGRCTPRSLCRGWSSGWCPSSVGWTCDCSCPGIRSDIWGGEFGLGFYGGANLVWGFGSTQNLPGLPTKKKRRFGRERRPTTKQRLFGNRISPPKEPDQMLTQSHSAWTQSKSRTTQETQRKDAIPQRKIPRNSGFQPWCQSGAKWMLSIHSSTTSHRSLVTASGQ